MRSIMQFSSRKFALGLLTVAIATSSVSTDVVALTAEVAKKCSASTAQAFPPRVPGNPAAGSAAGSYSDQRAYFAKCVADTEASQSSTNKPAAAPK
jgi:hypothetical protein